MFPNKFIQLHNLLKKIIFPILVITPISLQYIFIVFMLINLLF